MDMELLREAVKEQLAGKTDAENRIFNSEIFPVSDTALPAINIFTPSDISNGSTLLTDLKIAIYISADEGDNLGAALDALTRTVRREMKALFDDLGIPVEYTGRDTEYNGDAACAFATQTLTYQLETLDEI